MAYHNDGSIAAFSSFPSSSTSIHHNLKQQTKWRESKHVEHSLGSSQDVVGRGGRRLTVLELALTEEFIQMKVNGSENSASESKAKTGDNNERNMRKAAEETKSSATTNNSVTTPRQTPLADKLGYVALSSAQSLARVVGGANELADDDDMNIGLDEDNEADGYTKGAFGIANIFSGRGPASRRSRLLRWQRQELSDVRKEIAMASLTGDGTGFGRRSAIAEDGGGGGGRMTTLVAALPSSQKAATNNDEDIINDTVSDNNNDELVPTNKKDKTLITAALATLEKDMSMLDNLASLQPQLSGTEVGLLLGAVLASGMGPIVFPGTSVTEVLAPAAAACKFIHLCHDNQLFSFRTEKAFDISHLLGYVLQRNMFGMLYHNQINSYCFDHYWI